MAEMKPVAWMDRFGEIFKSVEVVRRDDVPLYTTAQLDQARREEAAKHVAELERLRDLAATAEKWRGIACAKFGDGRTVEEIRREARAEERQACHPFNFKTRIVDHDMLGSPITAGMLHELGEPRNEKGGA